VTLRASTGFETYFLNGGEIVRFGSRPSFVIFSSIASSMLYSISMFSSSVATILPVIACPNYVVVVCLGEVTPALKLTL
jgi:hypothetical protein